MGPADTGDAVVGLTLAEVVQLGYLGRRSVPKINALAEPDSERVVG